jgi:hypothetical protein
MRERTPEKAIRDWVKTLSDADIIFMIEKTPIPKEIVSLISKVCSKRDVVRVCIEKRESQ